MFQPEEGLVRGHGGLKFEVKILGITEAVWTDVREPVLDDTPPWEGLLLDARSLLPRIGPALVLAATALEVLISWVLDRLAERGPIPKELWTWINERGDYQREPSVEEQFGAILRICGGWSLKTDPKLWEAFKNLKAARNTFVHEGVAKIGKDLVDVKRASELVNGAMRIVVRTWEQLPDDLRWPRFSHTVQFQVAMPLALPAGVVLLDEA